MQYLPASAGADAIFAAYKNDGIVVIKGFLSPDQVQRFIDEVHPDLEKIILGGNDGGTEEARVLLELSGKKTKRLGELVTRSSVFRHELLEHDLMHQLLEKVFVEGPTDGYWMNASEVIEITPGSKAQPIHRDQELYPVWDRVGSVMPEAICNFLSALTPFLGINGATQVALGTHLENPNDHFLSSDFKGRPGLQTVPATMDPGDCIFFSGKILHGGGANQTTCENRRGLAMSFIRRILTPEVAYSLTISREIVDTMAYRGQAMLGFRSQWPVSKGMPSLYWAYQGSDIGKHIGLAEKEPFPGITV
jgi:ectoine hydroxylase-related dioxygenase (phytanoyl-CoA dioxygenase family)